MNLNFKQDYQLPFQSKKFTFALKWKSGDSETMAVDLSCVCLDKEGQVLDWVTFNSPTALNDSIFSRSGVIDKDGVAGDEFIYVRPQAVTTGQILMFVASAAKSPVQRSDLKTCAQLGFSIHAKDNEDVTTQIAATDLKPLVLDRKSCGTALTNGHQSMVICGAYLTEGGWKVSFDWWPLVSAVPQLLRSSTSGLRSVAAICVVTSSLSLAWMLNPSCAQVFRSERCTGDLAAEATNMRI